MQDFRSSNFKNILKSARLSDVLADEKRRTGSYLKNQLFQLNFIQSSEKIASYCTLTTASTGKGLHIADKSWGNVEMEMKAAQAR